MVMAVYISSALLDWQQQAGGWADEGVPLFLDAGQQIIRAALRPSHIRRCMRPGVQRCRDERRQRALIAASCEQTGP